MQTIYLVRHGQKETHPGEPGLTEVGILQAKQTGQYLTQFPIHKIIASPSKRTVQTAHYIGKELDLDQSLDKRLIERMDWEDNGISKKEFLVEWIKATNDRDYLPKYGDSSINAGLRVEESIKSLSPTDSHVLLVTHGGAIIDYLRNIFGDEKISKLRRQCEVGEDYSMHNCSINKIVLDKKPILELLNYADHLKVRSE